MRICNDCCKFVRCSTTIFERICLTAAIKVDSRLLPNNNSYLNINVSYCSKIRNKKSRQYLNNIEKIPILEGEIFCEHLNYYRFSLR